MKKTLLAAAALLCAMCASAEGYQINTLSAKQLGMGHTGVALKLGAESMIFNPAGLGFSTSTMDLSGSFTGVKAYVRAETAAGTFRTDNGISTPLAFNAAFKVVDNVQVGFSFYTPYGSSINWTKNWPGAVLNQKVNLKVFTFQPTVSWRITPKLSLGAGIMVSWGSVNLDKGLVSASTMDAVLAMLQKTGMGTMMGLDPDYRFGTTSPASVNLKGKSRVAVGVNVGAMYDVSDRVTVGASFRTKMTMKVKSGDASVDYANDIARVILEKDLDMINSANFKAAMPAPYVLTFGASWRPIDRLTLALDAQLTGWKTYDQLDIDFLDEKLSQYNQRLPKHYRNAWCFRLGGQFAATKRLDVRAGLMIDTTPVNDEHYNPETPGMTKIGPSVGLSFRPIKGLSIDVGFLYVAGLGKKDASCTYADLLAVKIPALGLPAERTFTADYNVHAFTPSIGVSYSF